MFWKPKTKTEWSLVISVLAITLVWAVLRVTWFGPFDIFRNFSGHEAGIFARGSAIDLPFIIPIWLLYGFLRVRARKQQAVKK